MSLQDMSPARQNFQKAPKKARFAKIKSACTQAQADGFYYIWVDTNCIDKSISVELSEEINSMFVWYGNSCVCYVYLFTRGWTLQELLAPKSMRSPENAMSCSIGGKMLRMAGRETSRGEDTTYYLLGIFDINIPLLYGEGSKALKRLQEEITSNR
ncbi:hypothetical protein B0O99DRAFT_652387 [Bisporella sp. PMI_857]|nr:hypothetical protein B0O99DRAFT_652387 [Bisporella sp. PMI_857]